MSARCLRSSNPSSNGEEPIECMSNLWVQQLKQGDMIWSRINGGSWWPVQVADENCISFKPKKIKKDEILVRLYGSFEHMYVDPVNCVSKIEKIFGQQKRSNREVFMKTLEEDITHMKSVVQSAATISESKETTEIAEIEKERESERDEAPGGKGQRKRKSKRNVIANNSPLVGSNNPKSAKQVKTSDIGITKRRTRSETFKARNDGASEIELSNCTVNLNISSSDKKDSKEILISNVLDNPSESICVKQDCVRNEDLNNKDIKKLVTKIVKEVAEKARFDASKSSGMESWPENIEYIDSSRKKTSEIKNMKRHVPRRVKNTDTDVEKPNLNKMRDFECERTKDIDIQLPNVVERENNEIQGMNGDVKSPLIFEEQDEAMKSSETEGTNGDQRGVSGEKIDSPSTTKCFLSPRCMKIMQSLGLIAPLGSPF